MIRPLHTATRGSYLIASTSRLPLRAVHSAIPIPTATAQFTIPPLLPFPIPTSSPYKGKGKAPDPKRHNEDEVDDAEWEMRVGESLPTRLGPSLWTRTVMLIDQEGGCYI